MALTKTSFSMITGAVGNVLDFGADNTGTADSTSAFTNALAAYSAVYIPAGTYKLASTVTVAQKKLFGDGPKQVILNYTGSAEAINASGTDAVNCHLEGFKLVGTSSATAGILVNAGCRRGIFRDIYTTGFTASGAWGVDLNASLNNGIYYNLFERVDATANRNGIRLYSSDGAANGNRVNSNTFVSCACNDNTGGNGVLLDYGNGNTFIGLNCESNVSAGIYIDNTYEVTFCGGYSENNAAALNATANAARIHYYGRRTIDAITGAGTATGPSVFFTTDNFSVDASGNISGNSIAVTNPIAVENTNAKIYAGNGTPEGAIAAYKGSIFMRLDGGANTTFYVKETGTGNTGWAAK